MLACLVQNGAKSRVEVRAVFHRHDGSFDCGNRRTARRKNTPACAEGSGKMHAAF